MSKLRTMQTDDRVLIKTWTINITVIFTEIMVNDTQELFPKRFLLI